jgi:hypothetical protein
LLFLHCFHTFVRRSVVRGAGAAASGAARAHALPHALYVGLILLSSARVLLSAVAVARPIRSVLCARRYSFRACARSNHWAHVSLELQHGQRVRTRCQPADCFVLVFGSGGFAAAHFHVRPVQDTGTRCVSALCFLVLLGFHTLCIELQADLRCVLNLHVLILWMLRVPCAPFLLQARATAAALLSATSRYALLSVPHPSLVDSPSAVPPI